MGSTRYTAEIHFYIRDDSPEEDRAHEDALAAFGAVLAEPEYEDLAYGAEGFLAQLDGDWERRVRVIQLLQRALARVRTVTPEQAQGIPDDKLKRI
jgi:hypothetical protein